MFSILVICLERTKSLNCLIIFWLIKNETSVFSQCLTVCVCTCSCGVNICLEVSLWWNINDAVPASTVQKSKGFGLRSSYVSKVAWMVYSGRLPGAELSATLLGPVMHYGPLRGQHQRPGKSCNCPANISCKWQGLRSALRRLRCSEWGSHGKFWVREDVESTGTHMPSD